MRKIILILTFALAVSRQGAAQAANALRQGVRIQVVPIHGMSHTGTLISLGNDSLFYAPVGSSSAIDNSKVVSSWALVDVRSVRVSRGRSALRGAITKGALGMGIGALSGAFLGAAAYSKSEPCRFSGGNLTGDCLGLQSRGMEAAAGGALGTVIGIIIGSVYGATHGNEQWETVQLPKR